MSVLSDKVASILPTLEGRGPVYLFAFAERENLERWDVVLSSDWSDQDWGGAVRFVAGLLGTRLEPHEKTMIARIAILPSDDPTMQELPMDLDGVVLGDRKMVHVSLLGSGVRQAFVFRAKRPPATAPREVLAGAASATP